MKKQRTCVYCGKPAQGNYSIHLDSNMCGPEVPLCDEDGQDVTPTCAEIWAVIAKTRRCTHCGSIATHICAANRITDTVGQGPPPLCEGHRHDRPCCSPIIPDKSPNEERALRWLENNDRVNTSRQQHAKSLAAAFDEFEKEIRTIPPESYCPPMTPFQHHQYIRRVADLEKRVRTEWNSAVEACARYAENQSDPFEEDDMRRELKR